MVFHQYFVPCTNGLFGAGVQHLAPRKTQTLSRHCSSTSLCHGADPDAQRALLEHVLSRRGVVDSVALSPTEDPDAQKSLLEHVFGDSGREIVFEIAVNINSESKKMLEMSSEDRELNTSDDYFVHDIYSPKKCGEGLDVEFKICQNIGFFYFQCCDCNSASSD